MTKDEDPPEGAVPVPESITCQRKVAGGKLCATDVKIERENLILVIRKGWKTPLVAAVCPNCGFRRVFPRNVSEKLQQAHFADVENPAEAAVAIEGGVMGEEEKGSRIAAEGPPESPSAALASRVVEALLLLQYDTPKWKSRVEAIRKLAQESLAYQSPDGLHNLLVTMSIDANHIPFILQYAFSGRQIVQSGPMVIPGFGGIATAGQGQFVLPNTAGAPQIVQTPSGPVIVMPANAPTMQPSREVVHEGMTTIEEILDEEGRVKKRIVRSPRGAQPADRANPLDDIKTVMGMAKELAQLAIPAGKKGEKDEVLEKMTEAIVTMGASIKALRDGPTPARELSRDDEKLEALTNEIAALREGKRDEALERIASQIAALEGRVEKGAPLIGAGTDPEVAKAVREDRALESVLDRVERIGRDVVEPIKEMYGQSTRLNTILVLRQMAAQDGVSIQDYLRAMLGAQEPTDSEVTATMQRWEAKRPKQGTHGGTTR